MTILNRIKQAADNHRIRPHQFQMFVSIIKPFDLRGSNFGTLMDLNQR